MTELNLTVIVSDEVLSDLIMAHRSGEMPLGRPKKLAPIMSKAKLKAGAQWVKENPLRYGVGYWNGFATEAEPSMVLWLTLPATNDPTTQDTPEVEPEVESEPVAETKVLPAPKAPPIPAPTE